MPWGSALGGWNSSSGSPCGIQVPTLAEATTLSWGELSKNRCASGYGLRYMDRCR